MKSALNVCLLICSMICLLFVCWVNGFLRGRITGLSRDREAVNLVLTLQYIKTDYYKPVNEKDCVNQIMAGGVSACTDKFSWFANKKDAEKDEGRKNGHFCGIGIRFAQKDKKIRIISVIEGSPAKKAGILSGDEIVAISSTGAGGNLISVSALETYEIVDLMIGAVGQKVLVSVSRNGKIVNFEMKRAEIINSSVIFSKPEDKIGYVKVTGFIRSTKDDFEAAVSSLTKSGVKALVIDLRDNPGGITQSVIGIISLFKSDAKPVIYIKKRDKPEAKVAPYWIKRGIFKDLKVVVLINEDSASSAEIMSGWLKEDFGASIVGKPTYGKDCGQEGFDFPDGSVLWLTTFHYLIGNKKVSVGNGGVKPTIEVANEKGKDKQLEIALKQAEKLLSK